MPQELPPITHKPHTICVIYKHDCLNVLVAMAICDEGRCRPHPIRGEMLARYAAAGIEAGYFPLSPSLQFWTDQAHLRMMATLKLAQHEGRQGVVDWARAELIKLGRKA